MESICGDIYRFDINRFEAILIQYILKGDSAIAKYKDVYYRISISEINLM